MGGASQPLPADTNLEVDSVMPENPSAQHYLTSYQSKNPISKKYPTFYSSGFSVPSEVGMLNSPALFNVSGSRYQKYCRDVNLLGAIGSPTLLGVGSPYHAKNFTPHTYYPCKDAVSTTSNGYLEMSTQTPPGELHQHDGSAGNEPVSLQQPTLLNYYSQIPEIKNAFTIKKDHIPSVLAVDTDDKRRQQPFGTLVTSSSSQFYVRQTPQPSSFYNSSMASQNIVEKPITLPLRLTFLTLVLITILSNFDHGTLPPCVDAIAAQLDLSFTEQSLLASLVYCGLVIGILISGTVLQRFDAQKTLAGSLAVMSVAILGLSVSHSLVALYVARFFSGMAQAFPAVYYPVWVDVFAPPSRIVRWMSYLNLASIGGTTLGYVVGGWFTQSSALSKRLAATWRMPFLLQGFTLLPVIVAVLLLRPEFLNTQKNVTTDTEKRLNRITGSSSSLLLHTMSSERRSPIDFTQSTNNESCIGFLRSSFEELKKLIRLPRYIMLSLGLSNLFFVATGIQFWVTQYLVEGLGFDKLTIVALSTICFATSPTLGVFTGGFLSDKLKGRRVEKTKKQTWLCTGLAGVAAFLAIAAGFANEYFIFLTLVWLSLFCGSAVAPIGMSLSIASVPAELRSLSSAVSQIVYNLLGWFAAPLVSGAIMDILLLHGYQSPLPLIWGFRSILFFSVFGFLSFIILNLFHVE